MSTTHAGAVALPVIEQAPRLEPGPSRATAWALGFVVWTALALLSSLQTVISIWSNGQVVDWSWLLPRNLLDWYTCAVFTPLYFWMVRRWPLQRAHAVRILAIYGGITAGMVVLKYMMYVPLVNALPAATRQITLASVLAGSFIRENVAFWCMLAAILTFEYYRTQRDREMREARLQTQLAQARLDALSAQLHPHFLFNTIQGISTLIHRDAEAADTMLARLSALLRHTLQRDAGHEVTLAQELELLELYLGIVRERFGDRLTVAFDVHDESLDVMVPRFLLQPLVENALHHGIARSAAPGRIDVAARLDGDVLVLIVSDDGPGPDPAPHGFPREGIGLGNTRDRLAQLYGAAQRLETTSRTGGGYTVTVRLPARRAVDA